MKNVVAVIISGFAAVAATVAAAADSELRFNRDIRPILSDTCYKCHGPDQNTLKADLRLDIREEALNDRGGYYAIDPGNAEESEVTWRIFSDDPEEMMPPPDSGKSLTGNQKELLRQWIDEGAEYEPHWSFIPLERHAPPAVQQEDRVRNPIDRFVLSRIEGEGIEPASPTGKRTLIRRVYFDLIGLPPTPDEVDAFLADDRPDAYERLVDRLMASPHYGERQAIPWLDVVRFADTTGYHSDDYRKMFPYRDYVIRSFNENKPFDEFTIQQLAGDLREDPTQEDQIAAGYNRLNQVTSEGGAQPDEYLAKYMADRVRAAGTVWLGLTMGCAECHDHKFDPISTKEFYSFGAFFSDIKEKGKYDHGRRNFAPYMLFPTDEQQKRLDRVEAELHEAKTSSPNDDVGKERRVRKIKKYEDENRKLVDEIDSTLVVERVEPRMIRVLPRGNWLDESGEIVAPTVPAALPPLEIGERRANRLDLARWMVDGRNPLTARTYVNRLWHQYFGTGISKVLDDLGAQGEWPSHPELLDWLALEFQDSGWDMKHMVRLIVTSNTYRQSSQGAAGARSRDPYNRLLARQSVVRLPAELVRDNALAVAGLLNTQIGGESVYPYQPEGYYADTYVSVGVPVSYSADMNEDQYRRGLYVFWKRSFLHPSLLAFDAPPREECTAVRDVSNTPQQALVLLNDPTYVEAARAFAERILSSGGDTRARIRFAYRTALGRDADAEEAALLSDLYERHRADYDANPESAEAFLGVGMHPVPEEMDQAELAAWTSVGRVVLNLHETITRY